jgi:pyridoxal 5'-phosphate synthase pdxT subunit
LKIGVLALQGGVIEHINHINSLGHEGIEVKKVTDLKDIQGIILPGGESTTIGKLLKERDIIIPLKEKILDGFPVWGTCAGMILLAKEIENEPSGYLKVMDIQVRRNAYGSQIDSFKTESIISEVSSSPLPLVFIRAPFITKVSQNVEALSTISGKIVMARQDNMLVSSFHPELTKNLEFHKYFLSLCS